MRFALTNVDMTPSTPAIEDSIKEIYQDYLQQCSVGDLPMLLYAHFGNFDHNQSELTLRTIEKVLADVHMKRSAIKHFCNLFFFRLLRFAKRYNVIVGLCRHGRKDTCWLGKPGNPEEQYRKPAIAIFLYEMRIAEAFIIS